jgi:hypothetical protein
VQASVHEIAKADRDIASPRRERLAEGRRDGCGRLVDDAGAALERVAQLIVRVREKSPDSVKAGEDLVGVVT